jgi:hypothetical protein
MENKGSKEGKRGKGFLPLLLSNEVSRHPPCKWLRGGNCPSRVLWPDYLVVVPAGERR